MSRLLVFLLLALPAFAQLRGDAPDGPAVWIDLPDAPAAQQPTHEFNKYSGHYILGWKEAATGKQFWIPYGAFWASSIADVEITHAGIAHHHCYEANPNFPRHPTRGELYREVLIEDAVLTGFGYAMRKLGFRWWVYDPAAAIGTGIHLHGAASWLGRCW